MPVYCIFFFVFFVIVLTGALPAIAAEPVPRVLLALYSRGSSEQARYSSAHQFLEMPANHLGYDIWHHAVEDPLPELGEEVRGVVVWYKPGTEVPDPAAYLDWLEVAVDQGKKLIIIEGLGIDGAFRGAPGGMQRINRLLGKVGLRDLNSWHPLTYDAHVLAVDNTLMGFERALPAVLPPYMELVALPGKATSHLRVSASNDDESSSDLVMTGPGGGYVAGGYALFEGYSQQSLEENDKAEKETEERYPVQQWYLNPFRFLRLALGGEDMPVPDTTTLNGRRIFYSHIDADGWNNVSQVEKYRKEQMLSSEVVQKEVLEVYPDIPFTVSVIVSEMDSECYGLPRSASVARAIFQLPNVEPGSHTHSHPLSWEFFEDGNSEKERPLLSYYPERPGQRKTLLSWLGGDEERLLAWNVPAYGQEATDDKEGDSRIPPVEGMKEELQPSYETPRSYACAPFDLGGEIGGAAEVISSLAPSGKSVRLVQWSGNTSPFEEALRRAREAGLLNINGGDSRFDTEYPSYASVSPIGLKVGKERQIYSSNSNENTYTRLWTDRFYGFIYLQRTVENTETPMRVKPFNLYFHMYSGEKQASLNALLNNLEFVRQQETIHVFAGDFARIANGFYTTQLISKGGGRWIIRDRGALQTLRFDAAERKQVDFLRSSGVLGQRYYQGSLYVSLDPAVEVPEVVLKARKDSGEYAKSSRPYLVESSWLIKNLHQVKNDLMFTAQGLKEGKIRLKFLLPGDYHVQARRGTALLLDTMVQSDPHGVVALMLNMDGREEITVRINLDPEI